MSLFAILVIAVSVTLASSFPSYGGGYDKAPVPSPATASKTVPAAAAFYSSANAPVTVPRLPCPKNYIFSCQTVLRPAPCSPHGHRVTSGAYSENVPAIVVPSEYVEGYQRS